MNKIRLKRWLKKGAIAIGISLVGITAYIYLIPFPEELLDRSRILPVRVVDREGRVLREGLSPDGTRGRWVPINEISPWLVTATLVAEDRRFRDHWGVDGSAIARAIRSNLSSGRRVSGASTVTMQLVRLMNPRRRSLLIKLDEAILALRLESRLTKDEILEEYLNRAPYGGNFTGVEAAALRTFGKPARDLSPAEAALLAGLPQSPVRLDPLRHPERAKRRQLWILNEMSRLGHLAPDVHQRAVAESKSFKPALPACEAGNFVDWVMRRGDVAVTTTLDSKLQRDIEGVLARSKDHLAMCGADEAAVVVVENSSGEILAFAGPAGRRRSPGSTLKPFVFGLAIEAGKTAASIYADSPVNFETPSGAYAPRNFDGMYHGRVSMRVALANSLNIPAILALRETGITRFISLSRDLGFEGIDPDPRRHGLGVVIGNAAASPVELAGAYSILARGGEHIPPHGRKGIFTPRRLFTAETAYVIADILSDDGARSLSFGTGTDLAFDFPVAAKTGTSPDHRDNWVAGFTGAYTAVVWVGNRDGHPMRGTSGLEGAGPIFRSVMLRLQGGWIPRPEGLVELDVCPDTGLLPAPDCERTVRELFCAGNRPRTTCHPAATVFRIDSPIQDDRFVMDPSAPTSTQFLRFRASAPRGDSLEWTLDGKPLATTREEHEVTWTPSSGPHELRVNCGGTMRVRRFEVR